MHRAIIAILVVLAAATPAVVQAQVHAHGSTWIHPNAAHPSWLHDDTDPLCMLEFPAGCYGGKMRPDSIHCEFRVAPPESMPRGCLRGYRFDMHDPQGGSMMSGRMAFRRNVTITLHYSREQVDALGIPLDRLVIIRLVNDHYEIAEEASHERDRDQFRLAVVLPSRWYGLADRSNLPLAAQPASWGNVKDAYR